MGRPKREWYPGAVYHVMSRGNYRREIYKDGEDYKLFRYLLQKITEEYGAQLHACCLMTNHYHLLLETGNKEIWKYMKRLNYTYSAYHNEKYQMTGHLFQGRYKACMVKEDAYFLQTSRYIHLNPVKARIVTCAENYEWSSYRALIGMEHREYVTVDKTYSYFKNNPEQAYRNFVEDTSLNRWEVQIRDSMEEDELWLPW